METQAFALEDWLGVRKGGTSAPRKDLKAEPDNEREELEATFQNPVCLNIILY